MNKSGEGQGVKAYVGMGANLGDPISQLLEAKQRLIGAEVVSNVCQSSFYASSPVGYSDQPDFINCVVEAYVNCEVRSFFRCLQMIETALGRQRDPNNQNGARLIDLDLLWFNDLTINESDLIVPHPRMHQRRFVLEPLAELNQDLASSLIARSNPNYFEGQELTKLVL